uniref:C3H1-type domain-containing protein n=1 Tax=Palpitomonas bilix TaxID=652834 RepID=A0A7S3LX25_9EUKA|mmetsp:Transcript_7762/g.20189  ORF Transcript_7762/g.20189 Transcript_7762/m.20189 type:complete len:295 (+) Transcript_7762:114-998(+)
MFNTALLALIWGTVILCVAVGIYALLTYKRHLRPLAHLQRDRLSRWSLLSSGARDVRRRKRGAESGAPVSLQFFPLYDIDEEKEEDQAHSAGESPQQSLAGDLEGSFIFWKEVQAQQTTAHIAPRWKIPSEEKERQFLDSLGEGSSPETGNNTQGSGSQHVSRSFSVDGALHDLRSWARRQGKKVGLELEEYDASGEGLTEDLLSEDEIAEWRRKTLRKLLFPPLKNNTQLNHQNRGNERTDSVAGMSEEPWENLLLKNAKQIPVFTKTACKYFMAGECKFGSRCWYSHGTVCL